jgi:hypothetical protein
MVNIPQSDEFLINLILQRTRPFIARVGKNALTHWTNTGDTSGLLLALGSSRADYIADALAEIESDVDQFCNLATPITPARFVSIGCGNGIAELFFWRRYKFDRLLLVDKETGGKGHGEQEDGAGYASLSQTVQFLRDNGVTCATETWNPANPAPSFPYDMLVSMLSMGFHYPAATYAKFMADNGAKGAVSIYDIRGNSRVVRRH